jgi:hypothetical protein
VTGTDPEPRRRASWNPLACTGTALDPPLLLAAKLLVVYALASQGVSWHGEIFLPFIESLDLVRDLVPPALPRAVFAGAAVALLLNRAVRAAAAACGLVVLWGIVASRPAFSNGATLLGCLLLLTGLGETGRTPWLLRVQVVLVYLGAGFHLAMLVFTGGAISRVFLYGMTASYLAFASWPGRPLRVWHDPAHGWLRALLVQLDVDRRLDVVTGPGGGGRDGVYLRLEHGGTPRTNTAALALVLGSSPPTYAALAALFFAARLLV